LLTTEAQSTQRLLLFYGGATLVANILTTVLFLFFAPFALFAAIYLKIELAANNAKHAKVIWFLMRVARLK